MTLAINVNPHKPAGEAWNAFGEAPDRAVDEVLAAGGALVRRGEFAPGCPYAYVIDPDGYRIELWYEP